MNAPSKPDRAVLARSSDWEICRYTRSGTYWIEYIGPDLIAPGSIAVSGDYDYPLRGSGCTRTKVDVATAAMLTAWTGSYRTVGRASAQFDRYLAKHRRNAKAAGIEMQT